jgi:hypothetical protein
MTTRSCENLYCKKKSVYGGDFVENTYEANNKTIYEIGYKINYKCLPGTIIRVRNKGNL